MTHLAWFLEGLFLLMLLQATRTDGLPVPVALYPLNGKHRTSDIGPKKNPPGIATDVQLAPGPYGHPQGSYQFSGSRTSYIEIPNNGGLDTKYSITVLAWVNIENEEGPIFNYHINSRSFPGFHMWNVNRRVYANVHGWRVQAYSSAVMASNSWYYVGATYDHSSGTAKAWVNGEETSSNAGIAERGSHYDVRMGALKTDRRYFKGRICCLQVYNKALSKEEIIAVQNRTRETGEYFVAVFHVQQQHQDDILIAFTASTEMECLLRCSWMTECKSVAIGGSSGGYCQLYRAPFKQSVEHNSHWKYTSYYNKDLQI